MDKDMSLLDVINYAKTLGQTYKINPQQIDKKY